MRFSPYIYTEKGHKISIIDNRICVNAVLKSDCEYAFYLTNKGEIEKKFYSRNNKTFFDKSITDGVYIISIFMRKDHEKAKIEKTLLVVHQGSFVQSQILSESENYKIVLYDLDSQNTFIVFNGAGSNKESLGFGLNYLLNKGFNVITCAQNDDQYQGLSWYDFKRIVSAHTFGKNVFLYGSSLGGYCSIYYAGAVNGTVIAAAPKNSAHPIMINRKKQSRFKSDDYKHKDIANHPKTDKPIYILVDPYIKSDIFFINTFIKPAYPNCNIIEVPHAGHEVLFHVNKLKKLSLLITSIVNDKGLPSEEILDFYEDTDFTLYGKALHSYTNLCKYLSILDGLDSRSPLIQKKLSRLKNKINKLEI